MMIGNIGSEITAQVMLLVVSPDVNAGLAAMQSSGAAIAPIHAAQVRAQNVAPEIVDQKGMVQYPAVNVYCEKIANQLTEKFRTFSGSAQVAIEIRHSQDRLDSLQDSLEIYADAIMQMLNSNRGDWGDGMFFAGAYQTTFSAVKRGGRNFLQTAKVTFEIGVSRS